MEVPVKRNELLNLIRWTTGQVRASRNDPELRQAWASCCAALLETYHQELETQGPPWEAAIRTLHGRGLTVQEMSRESGWSEGTIRNRLSALGLKCNRSV